MDLPKSLKKFEGFLRAKGEWNAHYDRASDLVLQQILGSKDGKMILQMDTDSGPHCFIPELDDIPSCFGERIWDNCVFEEKIKIINEYLEYFFQNSNVSKPKLRIIPKPNDAGENSCYACYNHNTNTVFIDLDRLANRSGMEILAILYHECTHAVDIDHIKNEVMPELLNTYIKDGDKPMSGSNCDKRILELDIQVLVPNYQTHKKEKLSTKKRLDILKCKNLISPFNLVKNDTPSSIYSKEDMKDYINSIMYYYSPLERFARISVLNFFRQQLKNEDLLTAKDQKYAENEMEKELRIDQKINSLKEMLVKDAPFGSKETIIDMRDLYDLVTQYKFYKKEFRFLSSNAQRFPEKAKEIEEKYDRTIGEIYSNFKFQQHKEDMFVM